MKKILITGSNGLLGQKLVEKLSTANDFETTLGVIDPTADREINLPNVSYRVIPSGNLSDITGLKQTAQIQLIKELGKIYQMTTLLDWEFVDHSGLNIPQEKFKD